MNTIIDIKNLSIGYSNRQIIKNINITVSPGEIIGIIGCNGSGKSTLLKTLRGLLPSQKGTIKYFGSDISNFTEKQMARMVAYLQQNINIDFGYTGRDIVLLGRYPYLKWWQKENMYDEDLATECMSYTGTADLADVPISEISGGQRQRILLAKVLAQQTPLLFLDEPTAGLDMVYQEEIFRLTKELAQMGKTILMVVHELSLAAKYCSRLLLLGKGQIIADGNAEQVFTEPLLGYAYNAAVQIIRNPISGNWEISTRIDTDARKKGQQLLSKICPSHTMGITPKK
ncbi:ABC transporter ATP-binding protein [Pectinatus frisingensis]|jgi:iron complex transport system ATP-binding protein|uniref:ABC transporter ATP-binding protein n=1 Tax=Pectinatus frisingensis TaxID=865 RepID=UPI0015F56EDD|nr:ABC transporter ATP-binding protein [Pectinatus frisingensis]